MSKRKNFLFIYFVILIINQNQSISQTIEGFSNDFVSVKHINFEEYTLSFYFEALNEFDMIFKVKGTGNLYNSRLSLEFGYFFIMVNYETIYSELTAIKESFTITKENSIEYSIMINVQSNITDHQIDTSAIENVTAGLHYFLHKTRSLIDSEEESDIFYGTRIYSNGNTEDLPKSSNDGNKNDSFLLILFIAMFMGVFIGAIVIVKLSNAEEIIFQKDNRKNQTIVKDYKKKVQLNVGIVKEFIENVKNNFLTISNNELIVIQQTLSEIKEEMLSYPYLEETKREKILKISNFQKINFRKDILTNLKNKNDEISNLNLKTVDCMYLIQNQILFLNNNYNINEFLQDYQFFINYCQKHKKDVVFEQMKIFSPLNSFELQSFEKSFLSIPNKDYTPGIDFNNFYNIIVTLFNSENSLILQALKEYKEYEQLLLDKRQKRDEFLRFIEVFLQDVEEILFLLNESIKD
jgi:hypothetical protein